MGQRSRRRRVESWAISGFSDDEEAPLKLLSCDGAKMFIVAILRNGWLLQRTFKVYLRRQLRLGALRAGFLSRRTLLPVHCPLVSQHAAYENVKARQDVVLDPIGHGDVQWLAHGTAGFPGGVQRVQQDQPIPAWRTAFGDVGWVQLSCEYEASDGVEQVHLAGVEVVERQDGTNTLPTILSHSLLAASCSGCHLKKVCAGQRPR